MNDLSPMSDLIADDLLLDRLSGRVHAGSEPVAGLLGALAAHADTPLPSRTGRRRIANKHRYLGAFAALAVAASGAGVAAAVTLPSNGPSQADRAAIVKKMDESARSDTPSALLSRLGLPQTSRTTEARGLVLARAEDGSIVLLPAAVVAARGRAAAAGTHGIPGVAAGAPGGGPATTGKGQNGQTGNGQGGTGGSVAPGGTTADPGGATAGGGETGTPLATNNGKKPAAGTKGGRKPTPTPTSTPTSTPTATSDVVPPTMLATAPPTTPVSRTRTTAPVKPRTTGTSGSSGSGTSGSTSGGASGPADSGDSGDSGDSSDSSDSSGPGGVDDLTGTVPDTVTDTITGPVDGAATAAAGVVDALTAPVLPTS